MPGLEHDEHSRARVIEAFREYGRVDLACQAAGVGRTCHYEWLKAYPDYAESFRLAKDAAIGLLEDKAKERAMSGESDRLLEFLLKGLKPEVYGDRMKQELTGANGGPVESRHEIVFVKPKGTKGEDAA